uniref:Uncharacterized protein n=1 Tax=Panagrolaimus sp. PS1159 TaxID=55785 RepID=A0AC35G047_9BILA
MSTKNFLSLKDKQQSFASDAKDDSRFSNLNLNRNYKLSDFSPVQSVSKSNNNKYCDSTVSDNREDKRKLQTWNKLSDSCLTTLSLNDKNEGVKKDWKKNDSLNSTKNSTLSFRISAYESSTEATVFDDSFNENDKKVLIKGKSVFDSTIVIENPFEFQRQQNDKISEPEMAQFIASQRLLNPNKASGNQHIIFKVQ